MTVGTADIRCSLRDAWLALWSSRALVWVAGVAAFLVVQPDPRSLDPANRTEPFGEVGDLLVAPAARWDAVAYLDIAQSGYGEESTAAFFPLYPLLAAVLGAPVGSDLVGGLVLSLVAFFAALVILHRLATLELGAERARPVVLLIAFFPGALWFSAIYTESLFLALSAGAFLAGRTRYWAWAGALGGLAAATRSAGVLLLVPLVVMYLRQPEPRRLASALWLALVPLGLACYLAYLAAATGDPLAAFTAQQGWEREFAGPGGGVVDGTTAAWRGAEQLLSGTTEPRGGVDARLLESSEHNVILFGFLVIAIATAVLALRRLDLAYGAYAVVGLALPLSYPVAHQPLMSLPRFLAVLFPLHMAVVSWAADRRAIAVILAISALGLTAFSAAFTTWEWVA